MYLDELFDVIITRSGEFILQNDEIEMNQGRFLTLVRTALGKYNRYRPVDLIFPLRTTNPRKFTFTNEFIPDGQDFAWGIPREISDVVPTRILGSSALSLFPTNAFPYGKTTKFFTTGGHTPDPRFGLPGQEQVRSDQLEKQSFPYLYRRPTLHVPYSADVEVTAIYDHPVIKEDPDADTNEKYNLPTIDYNEDTFLDLLQGMFLKSLGSSRKAFTLNDLPILTDGSEIAQEGKTLEEEAMDDLRTNKSKFYLAY